MKNGESPRNPNFPKIPEIKNKPHQCIINLFYIMIFVPQFGLKLTEWPCKATHHKAESVNGPLHSGRTLICLGAGHSKIREFLDMVSCWCLCEKKTTTFTRRKACPTPIPCRTSGPFTTVCGSKASLLEFLTRTIYRY